MSNSDRVILLSISITGGDPKTIIKDKNLDPQSILNHVENFHAQIKIM